MKTYSVSCSDLVKKSAMTICHFRKKDITVQPTERALKGEEHQKLASESKFVEMRGSLNIKDSIIGPDGKTPEEYRMYLNYCIDEIRITDKFPREMRIEFIEHKMIDPDSVVEPWYIEYSLIQTAFYRALIEINYNNHYQTATFHVNNGNPLLHLDMSRYKTDRFSMRSVLLIGDKRYQVVVRDINTIVGFYVEKAKASLDYKTAKEWDVKWKFKEYEYLKKYFHSSLF